eukprot:4306-Eustigmatos_ZCMA.PRE.1
MPRRWALISFGLGNVVAGSLLRSDHHVYDHDAHAGSYDPSYNANSAENGRRMALNLWSCRKSKTS